MHEASFCGRMPHLLLTFVIATLTGETRLVEISFEFGKEKCLLPSFFFPPCPTGIVFHPFGYKSHLWNKEIICCNAYKAAIKTLKLRYLVNIRNKKNSSIRKKAKYLQISTTFYTLSLKIRELFKSKIRLLDLSV